mmetsp:Transcript_101354/g.325728  ORF Transcript_101354/g.325728 Transcript_101354/m.325728 type:complete len:116 (+) Transcript_101354:131-478(+)
MLLRAAPRPLRTTSECAWLQHLRAGSRLQSIRDPQLLRGRRSSRIVTSTLSGASLGRVRELVGQNRLALAKWHQPSPELRRTFSGDIVHANIGLAFPAVFAIFRSPLFDAEIVAV